VVDQHALPPYRRVQAAIAEPPALVRQFDQSLLQGSVTQVRLGLSAPIEF